MSRKAKTDPEKATFLLQEKICGVISYTSVAVECTYKLRLCTSVFSLSAFVTEHARARMSVLYAIECKFMCMCVGMHVSLFKSIRA